MSVGVPLGLTPVVVSVGVCVVPTPEFVVPEFVVVDPAPGVIAGCELVVPGVVCGLVVLGVVCAPGVVCVVAAPGAVAVPAPVVCAAATPAQSNNAAAIPN